MADSPGTVKKGDISDNQAVLDNRSTGDQVTYIAHELWMHP